MLSSIDTSTKRNSFTIIDKPCPNIQGSFQDSTKISIPAIYCTISALITIASNLQDSLSYLHVRARARCVLGCYTHPQGCFVCYGRKRGVNHDHRTCPIHKADTEAYKKAHGSKKRAPAGIREAKVEVDRDELSKLVSQGTELAKEIQEIKRNWVPRSDNKNKENNQNDQNKDKDQNKGKKGGRKKGVNEVDAEENTPSSTTDAP